MISVEAIYLVSCVKTKSPHPAPAKELYTSDWFCKARAYVEASGQPWYILSAKYGMLAPETVVEPYERTLKRMKAAERRDWAERVEAQIRALPATKRFVILAGDAYRSLLMPALARLAPVEIPMEGLSFGRQLQWLEGHRPT